MNKAGAQVQAPTLLREPDDASEDEERNASKGESTYRCLVRKVHAALEVFDDGVVSSQESPTPSFSPQQPFRFKGCVSHRGVFTMCVS